MRNRLSIVLGVILANMAAAVLAVEMKSVDLPPAHGAPAEHAIMGQALAPVEDEVRWKMASNRQNAAGRVVGLRPARGRDGKCQAVKYAWKRPKGRIEYGA